MIFDGVTAGMSFDGGRNAAETCNCDVNPSELGKSCVALSIEDMLRQVPTGESRLFKRPCTCDGKERFFAVHQNFFYPGRLEWHNMLGLEENPWFGSRWKPRIPVAAVPDPDVTFKRSVKDLVDFYSTGCDAFFLSERLVSLIDRLDPGSLESRPVTIRVSRGGTVPFFMVMPNRSVSAVDAKRTDVLVKDKDYAGQWIRSITFPAGLSFRNEILTDVSSFTDLDVNGWFWSRELIEAAKAEGVRGVETVSARSTTGYSVDLF